MDQVFDLLGDPIPAGWGKRGRPQHIATQQNRNKVMMLLAFGWSNERIAKAVGITPPTLRKNYFRELKIRDDARDRMEGVLADKLFSMAVGGSVPALREFRKLVERNDQMAGQASFYGTDAPPRAAQPTKTKAVKLGKKEEADLAAATAGEGSDWGDDLLASSRAN